MRVPPAVSSPPPVSGGDVPTVPPSAAWVVPGSPTSTLSLCWHATRTTTRMAIEARVRRVCRSSMSCPFLDLEAGRSHRSHHGRFPVYLVRPPVGQSGVVGDGVTGLQVVLGVTDADPEIALQHEDAFFALVAERIGLVGKAGGYPCLEHLQGPPQVRCQQLVDQAVVADLQPSPLVSADDHRAPCRRGGGLDQVADAQSQGVGDLLQGAERRVAFSPFDLGQGTGGDAGSPGQLLDGESPAPRTANHLPEPPRGRLFSLVPVVHLTSDGVQYSERHRRVSTAAGNRLSATPGGPDRAPRAGGRASGGV